MDSTVTCISPPTSKACCWCKAVCTRNKQEYQGLAWIPLLRKETDDIIVGVVWTSQRYLLKWEKYGFNSFCNNKNITECYEGQEPHWEKNLCILKNFAKWISISKSLFNSFFVCIRMYITYAKPDVKKFLACLADISLLVQLWWRSNPMVKCTQLIPARLCTAHSSSWTLHPKIQAENNEQNISKVHESVWPV